MLFNSAVFLLVFLPILLAVYYRLGHRNQNAFLVVASCVFYASWDWRFLFALLFTTSIDYVCARQMQLSVTNGEPKARRKKFMLLSAVTNLGLLGFFKYFNFFAETLFELSTQVGLNISLNTFEIILPIGISFFTFQALSYTIDVYRGELHATKSFWDFFLAVLYFPHLVAGPIQRAANLLPQVTRPRVISREQIEDGVHLIIWGLFKRVCDEERLGKPFGTRFNVVNIAVPGMSIGKVDYLEHAEEQLAPRYAVIYPSPANYIGVTEPFCGRPTPPEPCRVSPLDHVRVLARLKDLSKRVIPPDVLTVARRASARIDARDGDVIETVSEETIDAFRRDLACIVDSAKRRDVRVVLVTHPTFFGRDRSVALTDLDRQQLAAWRRFYPELAEGGLLDLESRADAALRAYAADAGIEVVDAAAEVPPGPLYFADFVHLTDRGAAIVARLVARTISNDAHRVLVAAAQAQRTDADWHVAGATGVPQQTQ